jgi:SET domain-containing protein
MNHSEAPNVICPDNDDMFAGRDIEAGEELVCNYREFDRLAEADISSWKSQT